MSEDTPDPAGLAPEDLARACAETMWRHDRTSPGLGMALVAIGPGHAVIEMTVRPEMANAHEACHGGFIFTLADSAFGYACNSFGQRAVSQLMQIAYLAPARVGDRLRAEARAVWRQGRGGLYDIRVSDQNGTPVAECRGHSRTVKGRSFEEG